MMGFPAREASALPGNREEANRAGITPRVLLGTIDHSTISARGKPVCNLILLLVWERDDGIDGGCADDEEEDWR